MSIITEMRLRRTNTHQAVQFGLDELAVGAKFYADSLKSAFVKNADMVTEALKIFACTTDVSTGRSQPFIWTRVYTPETDISSVQENIRTGSTSTDDLAPKNCAICRARNDCLILQAVILKAKEEH